MKRRTRSNSARAVPSLSCSFRKAPNLGGSLSLDMVCYQEIIYLINLDNLVRQARAMDELQHHAASPDAAICTPGRAGATSPDAAAACHRVCTAKEKIREAGDELAWSVRRDARTQTRHKIGRAQV